MPAWMQVIEQRMEQLPSNRSTSMHYLVPTRHVEPEGMNGYVAGFVNLLTILIFEKTQPIHHADSAHLSTTIQHMGIFKIDFQKPQPDTLRQPYTGTVQKRSDQVFSAIEILEKAADLHPFQYHQYHGQPLRTLRPDDPAQFTERLRRYPPLNRSLPP